VKRKHKGIKKAAETPKKPKNEEEKKEVAVAPAPVVVPQKLIKDEVEKTLFIS